MQNLYKHHGITDVKCRTSANLPANDGSLSRRVENPKPKGMFLVKVAILGKNNVYELDAVFDTEVENTYGFYLCKGQGHQTIISYDTRSHTLLIDRTNFRSPTWHLDATKRMDFRFYLEIRQPTGVLPGS